MSYLFFAQLVKFMVSWHRPTSKRSHSTTLMLAALCYHKLWWSKSIQQKSSDNCLFFPLTVTSPPSVCRNKTRPPLYLSHDPAVPWVFCRRTATTRMPACVFLTMWTHPQRTAPQERTSSVGVCNRRSRPLLAQFSAAIVSTANHLSPHHSVPNILPNTAAFCMSSFSRSMNLPWGPLFILPASFNILCQKYKPVHVQTPEL